MEHSVDVVVVGGGIAGNAIAKAAAERGLDVLVLERQTSYRDKVRGEVMSTWGVAEARRLGVEDTLLAAGGTWLTHLVGYDEVLPPDQAEANPVRISSLCSDVPGVLAVGHPEACQALADAAQAAGATMVRGIGDVVVEPGTAPLVRYEFNDVEHEVRCRLVVGADGRASTVRRGLGYTLQQTEPRSLGGGMLVHGLDGWPSDRASAGTEGDLHYFVFPRPDGVARLYQMCAIDQKGRFSGPDREREFLDSFRMKCLPLGDEIAASTPAGPVAFYPWNDSWTNTPCAPGVVLVGDAAGWNDPIIGQGLAIAMRDARTVADVITSGDAWTAQAFNDYVTERAERMRRLCLTAELETDLRGVYTEAARERRRHVMAAMESDELLAAATVVTILVGPDAAPAEAFTPENIGRIRAMT
jgi:2-polyprenyl-6-methoxyphenol hydroxylase-like FAD-dependent oxidoreductase